LKSTGFLKAAALAAALSGFGAPASHAAVSAADAQTIAALTAELDQLEADLVKAEDTAAIKRLQRAYGYFLDKGMWPDLAELFTDDATAAYPAGRFVGKKNITQHVWRNVGDGDVGLKDRRLYNHMVLQPVVTLGPDGKTAKGRWRVLAMIGRLQDAEGKGGMASWAGGVYENEYRKENGVWKISSLTYYSDFAFPYEGGVAKVAPYKPPEPGAAPRERQMRLAQPPDAPRAQACPGFPAACIEPYHYNNPVSGREAPKQ
jgi:hypothetical protein